MYLSIIRVANHIDKSFDIRNCLGFVLNECLGSLMIPTHSESVDARLSVRSWHMSVVLLLSTTACHVSDGWKTDSMFLIVVIRLNMVTVVLNRISFFMLSHSQSLNVGNNMTVFLKAKSYNLFIVVRKVLLVVPQMMLH